jgi:hypothetical protein
MEFMKSPIRMLSVVALVFFVLLSGCNNRPNSKVKEEAKAEVSPCEAVACSEHSDGEGEESGQQFAKDERCDEVRKGSRLLLSYDKEAGAFTGTVENVSSELLDRVRVEVHLSNGTELGPTTQVDLAPGEKRALELKANGEEFESWSTHAEVGNSEHGHGEAGEHSHEDEHSHEGEHSHEHN